LNQDCDSVGLIIRTFVFLPELVRSVCDEIAADVESLELEDGFCSLIDGASFKTSKAPLEGEGPQRLEARVDFWAVDGLRGRFAELGAAPPLPVPIG
jgi:hypothetical protein